MAALALAKCPFAAQLIVVFALSKSIPAADADCCDWLVVVNLDVALVAVLLVGWKIVGGRPVPLQFFFSGEN
eukprot:5244338-Ditylum_brightwellii.AAC.1